MVWEFNNGRAKTSLVTRGFATYALLAERDIYGDDYFYFIPVGTTDKICFKDRFDSVLNTKASSLSFIKGAWALLCCMMQ
jgi:aminopeptidase N